MDIATGLRHGSWGRYSQRGRYLCNDRAPSSIGYEVAIVSAAAISKVAIYNGHCTYNCTTPYPRASLNQKIEFVTYK